MKNDLVNSKTDIESRFEERFEKTISFGCGTMFLVWLFNFLAIAALMILAVWLVSNFLM